MAVVIASNLRKDIAGSLLFEGVSFSVERGDRLSLSGPNGAGKTTLLRILAGETDLHGGELVFAKDTRVALHDQRPPIQSGLSLRDYALEGAADLAATEDELRTLEQAMADGDHGAATLARYAEAQARLEHAGGYDWRERAARTLRGLGFLDKDLDRPLATFSGGELTRASLARALCGRPRPAAARRAHEPPGRRQPRMARAGAAVTGRRRHPRRPRPLVPRGGHDGSPRARGRPLALLSGPLARLAPREGGPRGSGGEDGRARRRRHRAARALRRAVPVQEEQGEAGPGEADPHRAAGGGARGRGG